MRLTRAALRAEAIHVDNDESADASIESLPAADLKERVALGEITGNDQVDIADMALGRKTKAKGGKKAKGKKGKNVEDEATENEPIEVLEDERQAASSPASDAAVEDLAKGVHEDVVQVPMADERPASPPSRAVRKTRRQLKMEEEELSKSHNQAPPTLFAEEPAVEKRETTAQDFGTIPTAEEAEVAQEPIEPAAQAEVEESPANPELNEVSGEEKLADDIALGTIVESEAPVLSIETENLGTAQDVFPAQTFQVNTPDIAEPKSLATEKSCEDVISPRSPSRSPGRTPVRLDKSFEAIDALEEAIEAVGKAMPELESSDEKTSPRKKPAKKEVSKSSAATVKSSARQSTSQNPGALKPAKRPAPAANRPSIARSASFRDSCSKDRTEARKTSTTEVTDYLASKRRPISMSFPTPPPPPKSSRPPTKSTFQLPGEAVAAKLKAQKEERLKREEEEAAKKPAFKARPVPNFKSTAPKRTAASKARESLMHGSGLSSAPGPTILPPPKRTSSVNLKRQSTLTTTNKRSSSLMSGGTSIASGGADSKASRPAFTTSLSSDKRSSVVVGAPAAKSTVTAADVATQRLKAREIFNRDKMEKEGREKQRKEKEEAAKKARAEAAERSRIASREWAEKQKMKRAMAAPGPKAAE